ncbi:MAG: UDP-N-acetylmuramate dehydrogenase [Candidatus Moranbacteria bacterium]|nr:UDP-N-acetylmuramate dehydrogenase [Candidatus Moranbacteria bacterium]
MITIRENVALSPFTTFRIGGVAKYFATVASDADITEALRYAKEHRLRVFVLGGGSNILFSDTGFDGLVIKLENSGIESDGAHIIAGAGATLGDVIAFATGKGLAGMELMAGIPGSVGGAVRGNAGAFGVEIGDLTTEVTCLDTRSMEVKTLAKEACEFSYRKSIFKKNGQLLVLSVKIALTPGDALQIGRIAQETIAKREAKHPQHLSCAGSFFMNPTVTDEKLLEEFYHDTGVRARMNVLPAGWLIDHVGLRGKSVGGARVSDIHPNYILNTGTATAEDVLILSSIVKQRVRTQLGIRLMEEPQLVGF